MDKRRYGPVGLPGFGFRQPMVRGLPQALADQIAALTKDVVPLDQAPNPVQGSGPARAPWPFAPGGGQTDPSLRAERSNPFSDQMPDIRNRIDPSLRAERSNPFSDQMPDIRNQIDPSLRAERSNPDLLGPFTSDLTPPWDNIPWDRAPARYLRPEERPFDPPIPKRYPTLPGQEPMLGGHPAARDALKRLADGNFQLDDAIQLLSDQGLVRGDASRLSLEEKYLLATDHRPWGLDHHIHGQLLEDLWRRQEMEEADDGDGSFAAGLSPSAPRQGDLPQERGRRAETEAALSPITPPVSGTAGSGVSPFQEWKTDYPGADGQDPAASEIPYHAAAPGPGDDAMAARAKTQDRATDIPTEQIASEDRSEATDGGEAGQDKAAVKDPRFPFPNSKKGNAKLEADGEKLKKSLVADPDLKDTERTHIFGSFVLEGGFAPDATEGSHTFAGVTVPGLEQAKRIDPSITAKEPRDLDNDPAQTAKVYKALARKNTAAYGGLGRLEELNSQASASYILDTLHRFGDGGDETPPGIRPGGRRVIYQAVDKTLKDIDQETRDKYGIETPDGTDPKKTFDTIAKIHQAGLGGTFREKLQEQRNKWFPRERGWRDDYFVKERGD